VAQAHNAVRPNAQADLPRGEDGQFPPELRLAECAEYLAQRLGIPYKNARQRLYNALVFGLIRTYQYHDVKNSRIVPAEAHKPAGTWLISTSAFIEYAAGKRHRIKLK
jgi:hypothetical protein